MTAPGNRRRDGNAKAFAARDRVHEGKHSRPPKARASKYGRLLQRKRRQRS